MLGILQIRSQLFAFYEMSFSDFSICEFLHSKNLEEGDCGEYLERILTGVLSEIKHESAKILLDSLFVLSSFHLKVLIKLVCIL